MVKIRIRILATDGCIASEYIFLYSEHTYEILYSNKIHYYGYNNEYYIHSMMQSIKLYKMRSCLYPQLKPICIITKYVIKLVSYLNSLCAAMFRTIVLSAGFAVT
jgi:hypothetical protein